MILRKPDWHREKAPHEMANVQLPVPLATAFSLLLAVFMAFAAPSALAVEPAAADLGAASSDDIVAAADEYQGGTIPVLRLTFADDVDPESGEVTLSGDEKIELLNTSFNHEYKATGVTMDLVVPSSYDNPEEGLLDGVSGYEGESGLELEFIRGRGNSTWRAAKKPYKIKLNNKANLFGMGSDKHWALLANYYDESLSIDRIVGWIGDEMGMPYTPRGVPVDLFMNGEYYGNYLLIEEVRVDSSRVDIDEVDPEASDLDSLDITGDYLLGTNRKPTALPHEYFNTARGFAFSYETPEYELPLTEAQKAQKDYLLAHMNRVEDAVYGADFTNAEGDYVWDLIDKESFADMWLIQEFLVNPDAYATPSTYVYKLRDQVAADGTVVPGKLYWGPLWDFDFVWGKLPAEGFNNAQFMWASLLRQDPEFVELLKERWQVLDGVLEELTREGGLLDLYIEEMSESWEADRERWPQDKPTDWDDESYVETIEELRSHINARRAWINANLDKLLTVYHRVTFKDGENVLHEVMVPDGAPAWEDAPDAPEKEGMLFHGWFTEDGVEYDCDEPCCEDAVYYAQYYDEATVSKATDIFFAQPEVWIRYGTSLKYDALPADAIDKRVSWSSSAEDIVGVNDNGYAYSVVDLSDGAATAEAVVTAHLVGSGVEAQVRVVVYDPSRIELAPPESIAFDEAVAVKVGEYRQLNYTVEPVPNTLNEVFTLDFSVDDDTVAEVTSTGVVVGKAPGTARVVVSMLNLDTNMYEEIAAVRVTVEAEPSPEPEPGPDPDPDPEPDPGPDPDPVAEATYSIVIGDGGTWAKGTSAPLSFTAKRSVDDDKTFDHFVGIQADGKDVDAASYTAKAGSVVLELKPTYLETLAVGPHTLTVQFDDGSVDAKFNVTAKAASSGASSSPKTGDDGSVVCLLLFTCAIGLAGMMLANAARKRSA